MLAEPASVMEAAMTYAALPTFYRMYANPAAVGWVFTAFLLVGEPRDYAARSAILWADARYSSFETSAATKIAVWPA